MTKIKISKDRFELFEKSLLLTGKHEDINAGGCIMEWSAFLAGHAHTDSDSCVSPVIAAFLRSWNDSLGDDDRQKLKRFAVPVLGTASTRKAEDRRAWLAADWLVRTYLPAWLDLAKLTQDAETLRLLPQVTALTINATRPALEAARKKTAAAGAAAWDAAWAAAGAAARAAAWAAAGDAAGAAARAAAWAAAWAAARDAARAAAGAAAGDAARDAAWAAAGDAAWAAAGDAAGAAARDAAWAAAWAAAGDALASTVKRLQDSALDLLDRMINDSGGKQ